jgi:ABC-type uncharacterized transport system substrate-binding protein
MQCHGGAALRAGTACQATRTCLAPSAKKIGILTNLQDPKAPPQAQELEAAAKRSNVTIVAANVDRPEEIEAALRSLADHRPDVVIVLQTSALFAGKVALALRRQRPHFKAIASTERMATRCQGAICLSHRRLLQQNRSRPVNLRLSKCCPLCPE